MSGVWRTLMHPHISRFELAAMVKGSATYNAEGAAAFAALLKEMCRMLDEEIGRRVSIEDKELREDDEFFKKYERAYHNLSMDNIARILSDRLRQMDKRAKAANARADAAERKVREMQGI